MNGIATTRNALLLGATLVGLAAISLGAAGSAFARVGVTSASDGDPLGKPPNANERILRIGIDVQADELVTTGATDRAHLVFLDGSSLTVGPNARLTIDRFVYDPNTQKGDLAINASKGVFRLVGGRISKSKPITITTPSGAIGIRGGITIFSVTPSQTVADFVFGSSMTVTAGGRTETATRAGSQVITNVGGVPGAPALLKQGSLGAALNQLEGGTANDNKRPDQSAEKSGFASQNSGQPANAGPNGPPTLANNTLINAVSNATIETQQATSARQASTAPQVNAVTPTASTASPPGNIPIVNPTPPPNTNPAPPPLLPPSPPSGPARTSQTLTGYAAGLVYGQANSGGYHSTPTNLQRLPGEVSITTDATNSQARGTLVIRDLAGSHRHSSTTLQLGGTGGLGVANSAFVDDKTYVMVTQYNDWSRLSSWREGGATYQATDTTVLVSGNAAPIPLQVPLQGTPGACACEFLSWGWWAAKVPDPRDDGRTYTALGPYVVGKLTTSVQMPQTGSATYNGFMTGMVDNRGNVYAGAGTYQNDWDFRGRTGSFNGTFDGRGYSGATQAVSASNGQTFTGSFSGGSRSGALSGAFFSSPSDPAAYQAGTFSIGNSHSRYKASGIFAGQR